MCVCVCTVLDYGHRLHRGSLPSFDLCRGRRRRAGENPPSLLRQKAASPAPGPGRAAAKGCESRIKLPSHLRFGAAGQKPQPYK